eukprot:2219425-Rhodomonas_salina.1
MDACLVRAQNPHAILLFGLALKCVLASVGWTGGPARWLLARDRRNRSPGYAPLFHLILFYFIFAFLPRLCLEAVLLRSCSCLAPVAFLSCSPLAPTLLQHAPTSCPFLLPRPRSYLTPTALLPPAIPRQQQRPSLQLFAPTAALAHP